MGGRSSIDTRNVRLNNSSNSSGESGFTNPSHLRQAKRNIGDDVISLQEDHMLHLKFNEISFVIYKRLISNAKPQSISNKHLEKYVKKSTNKVRDK